MCEVRGPRDAEVAVPMGQVAKSFFSTGHEMWSCRPAWNAWHFVTFRLLTGRQRHVFFDFFHGPRAPHTWNVTTPATQNDMTTSSDSSKRTCLCDFSHRHGNFSLTKVRHFRHRAMSQSAALATQNGMTTSFDTSSKGRFCDLVHRHGSFSITRVVLSFRVASVAHCDIPRV